MILACLNQKGGAGKTTMALHFADWLAKQGSRVLFVDADPQGSALAWSSVRKDSPPFSVVGYPKATLHRDILRLSEGYAHVIIDGPPRATDLAASAIGAADCVVIPVQPSPLDLWAAQEIVDLIADINLRRESSGMPTAGACIVINRKIIGTAIAKGVEKALDRFKLPVSSTSIAQRVLFAEAFTTGQTVFDIAPKSAAAKEMEAAIKDVCEYETSRHTQSSSA